MGLSVDGRKIAIVNHLKKLFDEFSHFNFSNDITLDFRKLDIGVFVCFATFYRPNDELIL